MRLEFGWPLEFSCLHPWFVWVKIPTTSVYFPFLHALLTRPHPSQSKAFSAGDYPSSLSYWASCVGINHVGLLVFFFWTTGNPVHFENQIKCRAEHSILHRSNNYVVHVQWFYITGCMIPLEFCFYFSAKLVNFSLCLLHMHALFIISNYQCFWHAWLLVEIKWTNIFS